MRPTEESRGGYPLERISCGARAHVQPDRRPSASPAYVPGRRYRFRWNEAHPTFSARGGPGAGRRQRNHPRRHSLVARTEENALFSYSSIDGDHAICIELRDGERNSMSVYADVGDFVAAGVGGIGSDRTGIERFGERAQIEHGFEVGMRGGVVID